MSLTFRSPEIGTGVRLFFGIGVHAEVNVSSYESLDSLSFVSDPASGAVMPQVSKVTRNDIPNLQGFTASFVPRTGVDWEFDWGMVSTGVSYHHGLVNILGKGSESTRSNVKLNYVAIDLGYFF